MSGVATASSDPDTSPQDVDALIVGGDPISITAAPWQVALLFANASSAADDGFLDQFCGGSLISNQWIVTAAHCMVDEDSVELLPAEVEVAVGESVLSEISSADRLAVDRVVISPDYDGDVVSDIALLRLSSPVAFSGTTAPIAIPEVAWQGNLPAAGTALQVTGWGCRSPIEDAEPCPDVADLYFANQLESVEVSDISGPTSSNCGANLDYDPTIMLCAGDEAGVVDSCSGDSGGPLAVVPNWWTATLVGVVSFGVGCAQPSFPGVYTRVSAFTAWIAATTGVTPGDSGWTPSFVSVEPGRVVDTRVSGSKVDGVSRFRIADANVVGDPSRSGESIGVPVGAGAVAINVTVTGTEAPGFVSVYPCADTDAAVPNVSNVNYAANATVANSAVVPLSADGYLCVKAVGATHVLIDVAGYFVSGFTTVEPGRVVDTRLTGTKVSDVSRFKIADANVVGDPLRSGESIGVPVGAGAVAINVTVTGTEAPGFVSVYPCTAITDTPPNVSNVNYVAGATVANSAVVPLSADGYLCVKAVGATYVLIDVAGYFVSGFTTVEPGRVVDTRFGDPKVDGVSRFRIADAMVVGDPSRSGESIGVPVGAGAVAINVTVTGTEAPGFVSVYPCTAITDTPPNVSNVNYVAGATVANSAVVPLSGGALCVSAVGATHVLIDVSGYLAD